MTRDKPRRGSGSEKRQRMKVAVIRLTPAEHAEADAAAQRAGLTLSSYGRAQMLSASPPRSVRRPPVEKELLARVLGQLGKAGSNLNQVARAANLGKDDLADMRAAVAEIRLAVDAVLKALGRRS